MGVFLSQNTQDTLDTLGTGVLNTYAERPDSGNGWPSTFEMIGQFFLLVGALAVVVFLAYFVIKLMGSARTAGRGGNIRIVEAVGCGHQNSIMLVKAGEKYLLIGSTKERITLLTEVSPEDVVMPKNNPAQSFEKYLKYFRKDNSSANLQEISEESQSGESQGKGENDVS